MISIQKKKFYLTTILSSVILGICLIVLLYSFSWTIILESYTEYNGALVQWFKQEEQYFSDLPFLFGLFFLLLVFGKALDMYNAFIFFQVGELMVLIITKIRFIIMILDFLPMIYLSIGMILFSLSLKEKNRSLRDEKRLNAVRVRIIILIIIGELTAILTINSISIISILYPIVVIPSLITIVWLFNFAYRNKRLSQVNASILWIGFSAYLVSQIVRPLVQFIIGESALFLIIAETLDLSIFVVIFIGFYKRANYSVIKT
jgi:hypothetical protein